MPLSAEAIRQNLTTMYGWHVERDEIKKTYEFKTFIEALSFVNRVARIAEAEDHHPGIHISHTKVILTLTTHSEGGLTEKDFAVARIIDGS
jgi:4a-hydroxytetrahydrobiopterin dehydratase